MDTPVNPLERLPQTVVFVAGMALGSIFSLVIWGIIRRVMPESLPQAAFWLIIWFFLRCSAGF